MVIFASPKNPLAKKEHVTPAELALAPLILRRYENSGVGHKMLRQLKATGLKPNIAMHCESAEGVKTQVRIGVGLGILYHDLVIADIRKGDFRVIKVPKLDLDGESFIIYDRRRALSAQTREFLDLLRQWRHKNGDA